MIPDVDLYFDYIFHFLDSNKKYSYNPMLHDPTDILKVYLNQNIFVRLKSGEIIEGTLGGFDEYHSLLLLYSSHTKFIRGENVLLVGQK